MNVIFLVEFWVEPKRETLQSALNMLVESDRTADAVGIENQLVV